MASRLPNHPPEEFVRMFVQQGRLACETHFKASRRLIDAWLRQTGKAQLIDARGAHVARSGQKLRQLSSGARRLSIVTDSRPVNPRVASAAAHFLRVSRNGGWIVSRTQFGDWRVGTKRLTANQVVEMAVSKGFDPKGVSDG